VLQNGLFVAGGIMKSAKINPNALLSKEWIMESFFDMLAVKPLSSITISEIAENAKVDRRTFYRHFKTKEGVDFPRYFEHEVKPQNLLLMLLV